MIMWIKGKEKGWKISITCESRWMLVVSLIIALAIPKSISFREPLTRRKFAGFKSECTIRSSWIVLTAWRICCKMVSSKHSGNLPRQSSKTIQFLFHPTKKESGKRKKNTHSHNCHEPFLLKSLSCSVKAYEWFHI